jgi:hypothetical protein
MTPKGQVCMVKPRFTEVPSIVAAIIEVTRIVGNPTLRL